MKIPWVQILTAALTSSLFTASVVVGLAYVGRSIIERWLARDLEKYKAELQLAASEQQTKSARFHEKQFKAIVELYKRLGQSQAKLQAMAGHLVERGSSSPPREADPTTIAAIDSLAAFQNYFRENRLYFAQNVCEKINRFMHLSSLVLIALHYSQVNLSHSESTRGDLIAEALEGADPVMLVKKAITRLYEEIPDLEREIEQEFLKMLRDTES